MHRGVCVYIYMSLYSASLCNMFGYRTAPCLCLQAVENAGVLLSQVLKTQARLKDSMEKLKGLNGKEAEEYPGFTHIWIVNCFVASGTWAADLGFGHVSCEI